MAACTSLVSSGLEQELAELAPRVRTTVRAVLGAQHPDVDDAIQQALIALHRALPAYRGECDVTGYARVIATRVAIGVRRRDRAVRIRHDDGAEPDLIAEVRPSPAETMGARERKAIIRELLAEMPEAQAETLALRIVLGLSLDEVAAHTGVPVNTVRSRLRLAKERLKQRIESDPMLMEALGD
jgi:RNA polymerase sigma factor (sigma-70 family)